MRAVPHLPEDPYLLARLHEDVSNTLNQLSTINYLLKSKVDLDRRIRKAPEGPVTFGPLLARVSDQLQESQINFQICVSNIGTYLAPDAIARASRLMTVVNQTFEEATRLRRAAEPTEEQLSSLLREYESIPVLFDSFLDDLRQLQREIFRRLDQSSSGVLPTRTSDEPPPPPDCRYKKAVNDHLLTGAEPTPSTQAAERVVDKISDKGWMILRVLFEKEARDRESRLTQEVIAKANPKIGNHGSLIFKNAVKLLKTQQLVMTAAHRGGGMWLTEAGYEVVLRKPRPPARG
jgi:hypothetical protein